MDATVYLSTALNFLAGEGLRDFTGQPLTLCPPLLPPVAGGRRLGRHRAAGCGSIDLRRGLRADHPRRGVLAALKSPVAVAGAGRHRNHRGLPPLELLGTPPQELSPSRPACAPRLDPVGGLPQPADSRVPVVGGGFHRAGRPDPLSGRGPNRRWRPHPAAPCPAEAYSHLWRDLVPPLAGGIGAQLGGHRGPDPSNRGQNRGPKPLGAVPSRRVTSDRQCVPRVARPPQRAGWVCVSAMAGGRRDRPRQHRGHPSRPPAGPKRHAGLFPLGAGDPLRGVRLDLSRIPNRRRATHGCSGHR